MTRPELLAYLLQHAHIGEFAPFHELPEEQRTINASDLRVYLLTEPYPLKVQGAHVEGILDLSHARRDGDSPLQPIFLHDCHINGSLHFTGAKLNGLSLQGSLFRELNVVSAIILGDLDCSKTSPFSSTTTSLRQPAQTPPEGGLRPHPDAAVQHNETADTNTASQDTANRDGGNPTIQDHEAGLSEDPAYILGRGVRITGGLNLQNATLIALPKRTDIPYAEDKHWAAQLNDSRIDGTVRLMHCTAYGGIHLGGSHIQGDVWCAGMGCTATEGDALRLQTATISGVLSIDGSARIAGLVFLLEAKIGTLNFGKGTFIPDEEGYCIMGSPMEVCGNLTFSEGFKTLEGRILLDDVRIRGSLRCNGCEFNGLKQHSPKRRESWGAVCFSAARAKVEGELRLQAKVEGAVNLSDIEVKGGIDFGSSRLTCVSGDRPPCALNLSNAHIGSDLSFGSNFQSLGLVVLELAEIGGSLFFSNSQVTSLVKPGQSLANAEQYERAHWSEFALFAKNVKVKGSVQFLGSRKQARTEIRKGSQGRRVKPLSDCKVLGAVSFAGAEIGHEFLWSTIDLLLAHKREVMAADLSACSVGGAFKIEHCSFDGRLTLAYANLGGYLQIADTSFLPLAGAALRGSVLDLTSARISHLVELTATQCYGAVVLAFCRVDAPLHILSCSLWQGLASIGKVESRSAALLAEAADIRGELVIARQLNAAEAAEVHGLIDLSRAHVGGRVRFERCTLTGVSDSSFPSGSPLALQAEQLSVNGSLEFVHVTVKGSIQAKHVTIRTNLFWNDLTFALPDSVSNTELTSKTRFDLQRIQIGGALQAKKLAQELPLIIDLSSGSANALEDNVTSGWGLRTTRDRSNLKPPVDVLLENFTYQSTCDDYKSTGGWLHRLFVALEHNQPRAARLFRSFTLPFLWFGLFLERAARAIARILQSWARQFLGILVPKPDTFHGRLYWLGKHHTNTLRHRHHPQPYRRLSSVLRTQGFNVLSRKVAVTDSWKELQSELHFASFGRKLYLGPFVMPFGLLFGFGLDPLRAFCTLMVFLVLGLAGVSHEAKKDLLVLTSPPLETKLQTHAPIQPAAAQLSCANKAKQAPAPPQTASESPLPELFLSSPTSKPCEVMTSPHSRMEASQAELSYVVNLALPLVQLHEKSECELASPTSTTDLQRSNELSTWRMVENVYSLLAKLVTTLALITFSGVLRRSE